MHTLRAGLTRAIALSHVPLSFIFCTLCFRCTRTALVTIFAITLTSDDETFLAASDYPANLQTWAIKGIQVAKAKMPSCRKEVQAVEAVGRN
jgi:hypothetical protein